MKVVDALSKVYTAMGGEDEFSENVAEGIEQISEVAGSGGGGGGGSLIVTATVESDYLVLNKTYKEITDAVEAGTYVVLYHVTDNYLTLTGSVFGYGYDSDNGFYDLKTMLGGESAEFIASAEDGYPAALIE